MKGLYLIAILPPADLADQIDQIRRECSLRFNVYKALRPPVHITLYPPFRFEASYEKQLNYIVQQHTADNTEFTQHLENFGHFRKEVVFIRALKSPDLADLQQAVTRVFRTENSPRRNEPADFHPHITIAYRDVTPDKFDKIWNEYKVRGYTANFVVKHFTLLKHDNVRWNPVKDFRLGPTAQASRW